MAVISINFEKIEKETLLLLRKELSILKTEKEFIDNSNYLKHDSDVSTIYNSICNRYEEVQKQIRWLNLICSEYKKNIREGVESITGLKIPSIETPGFQIN